MIDCTFAHCGSVVAYTGTGAITVQLTRAADYALRAAIHLARVPAGVRVSSAELAAAVEVSEPFLSKVLQKLVAHGIVASYRGQGGGFLLTRAPVETSVLEIVEAIEGPIAFARETLATHLKKPHGFRAAHRVWDEARMKVKEVLGAARLDRMAAETTAEQAHFADEPESVSEHDLSISRQA